MTPIMKKRLLFASLFLCIATQRLFAQIPAPFNRILNSIQDSVTKKVLENPDIYRYQIVYTQINRDKKGAPHFTNYTLEVSPEKYFKR